MQHSEYFRYLQTRGRLGALYRRFWLYPRLSRQLLGRTLDVGCGMGDMVAFRPNTVGCDVNPHSVQWVRERGLIAEVILDGRLPFESASFDSVILDNVLEHIEDPTQLLMEIRRVLRPGGRLVVGVPGTRGYASDPDHKVFYDHDGLRSRMRQAGFTERRSFFMPLPLVWLDTRISQFCLYGVFDRLDG